MIKRIKWLFIVMVILMYAHIGVYADHIQSIDYTEDAKILNALEMLSGSNGNYELDRVPTLVEGAIMNVKIMGRNSEVSVGKYGHPFEDVPPWADNYIGLLYAKNMISGISYNKLGVDKPLSGNAYATMMLKILGYDEKKGDFQSAQALEFALEKGIINTDEKKQMESQFLRNEMIGLSMATLKAKQKDTDITLLDTYIEKDIIELQLASDLNLIDLPTIPVEVLSTEKGMVIRLYFDDAENDILDSRFISFTYSSKDDVDFEHVLEFTKLTNSEKQDIIKAVKAAIVAGELHDSPYSEENITEIEKEEGYHRKTVFHILFDEDMNITHYFKMPNDLQEGMYHVPVMTYSVNQSKTRAQ